jgi:hypothetical protein
MASTKPKAQSWCKTLKHLGYFMMPKLGSQLHQAIEFPILGLDEASNRSN